MDEVDPLCGTRPPARLGFIDETSANKLMRPRAVALAASGWRAMCCKTAGKTLVFVAALRRNGMTAARTIGSTMTGKKFLTCAERCLAPTHKRNEIVMIDNPPAHKAAGVREATVSRGATLGYLPKYCPEPQPDRDVLQQIDGLSAQGRRAGDSSAAPSDRLVRSQPHCREATNYFQHAGYALNRSESLQRGH
jgi:hypothetical protein